MTLFNTKMPGVAVETRPLTIYFLLDISGSMRGEKIRNLNEALKKAIPLLRQESEENAGNARIYIRAMQFGTGAQWLSDAPIPVEEYEWKDIEVSGQTSLGAAIDLLRAEFESLAGERKRMLAPVVILVSDGNPTDSYKMKFRSLLDNKIGKNAVKLAIAIGSDADTKMLEEFIDNEDVPVLTADQPDEIVKKLVYASIAGSKSSIGNVMLINDDEADKFDA